MLLKLAAAAFFALGAASPIAAQVPAAPGAAAPGLEELSHGGGCRKASPPGQCCHAGSQPYHCH